MKLTAKRACDWWPGCAAHVLINLIHLPAEAAAAAGQTAVSVSVARRQFIMTRSRKAASNIDEISAAINFHTRGSQQRRACRQRCVCLRCVAGHHVALEPHRTSTTHLPLIHAETPLASISCRSVVSFQFAGDLLHNLLRICCRQYGHHSLPSGLVVLHRSL